MGILIYSAGQGFKYFLPYFPGISLTLKVIASIAADDFLNFLKHDFQRK